jgi:hypothetical protein
MQPLFFCNHCYIVSLVNYREAIIVIVSASVRRGADAERYGLQEDYYYYCELSRGTDSVTVLACCSKL